MATTICVNGVATAAKVRKGTNDRGSWEMIVVKPQNKGGRTIVIFAENTPTGVVEGGDFRVDKITEVRAKSAKDANGNWTKTEIVARAVVEPVMKVSDLDDSDLYGDFGEDYDLDLEKF